MTNSGARHRDIGAALRLAETPRDRAQILGIDAYYRYLEALPAGDQDKPWAVTNALLDCINAALGAALTPSSGPSRADGLAPEAVQLIRRFAGWRCNSIHQRDVGSPCANCVDMATRGFELVGALAPVVGEPEESD